ncbi:sigma-70 family RNA polymerase sigma factor [Gemmata sp.]|uniref:sigma-70 family RNA polymerase sigma factor n=1 Tax=Gemmata sp. TaxID=1914242 RepID=UPI003F6FEFCA
MTAHEALPRVERLIRWHARRRVGPGRDADADDLAQDATVRLLESFPKFNGNPGLLPQFTSWMCYRASEARTTRHARDAQVAAHLRDLAARDAARPGCAADGPDSEDAAAEAARLRAAVERLPAQQRAAVVRVFGLDGRGPATRKGVAAELGVTHQAVSDRVKRAVAALRAMLTEGRPSTSPATPPATARPRPHPEFDMPNPLSRPKGRREMVPLDRLTFDPAFQVRGEPFNEAHVCRLVEVLDDDGEFDPLDVVEVAPPGGKGLSRLYVIDGFNRGEAHRRRGTGSVACLVLPGTRADAELWALASNSKQPLARTPEDCRRAFDRLVGNPALLERVIEGSRGTGGTERGIARACGLSHGIVGKYLHESGLRSDRRTGRLVAAAPDAAPTGRQPSANRTTAAPAREVEVEVRAAGDPVEAAVEASLANAKALVRALGREVEVLLRSRVGDQLRAALRSHGLPLAVAEREELAPIGTTAPPKTRRTETWPVVGDLVAALGEVQASVYARQAG